MVIFQILLLSDKRVISKERNTVRASNPRASLTWTDNTSKVGYETNCLCHIVVRSLDSIIPSFYIRNFKPLQSFCDCAGRFVLVANPEDRFSRDEAHMSFNKECI